MRTLTAAIESVDPEQPLEIRVAPGVCPPESHGLSLETVATFTLIGAGMDRTRIESGLSTYWPYCSTSTAPLVTLKDVELAGVSAVASNIFLDRVRTSLEVAAEGGSGCATGALVTRSDLYRVVGEREVGLSIYDSVLHDGLSASGIETSHYHLERCRLSGSLSTGGKASVSVHDSLFIGNGTGAAVSWRTQYIARGGGVFVDGTLFDGYTTLIDSRCQQDAERGQCSGIFIQRSVLSNVQHAAYIGDGNDPQAVTFVGCDFDDVTGELIVNESTLTTVEILEAPPGMKPAPKHWNGIENSLPGQAQ